MHGTQDLVVILSTPELLRKAVPKQMAVAPFTSEHEWLDSEKDHAKSDKITGTSVSFCGEDWLDI
jgi:hypothetical protein